MGRRERLERRLERRREWADARRAKAASGFNAARQAVAGIPPGQPILVGHHSERHHRRALARHDSAMRRAVESSDMAAKHELAADGLERALDRSIYSDDANAAEALSERAESREALAEAYAALNRDWRRAKCKTKGDTAAWLAEQARTATDPLRKAALVYAARGLHLAWQDNPPPIPGYALANLRANIRRDRKRRELVERQKADQVEAEAAGGTIIEQHGEGYALVRFADYPGREIVAALKAAGFFWSGPSRAWYGKAEAIPAEVRAMVQA